MLYKSQIYPSHDLFTIAVHYHASTISECVNSYMKIKRTGMQCV